MAPAVGGRQFCLCGAQIGGHGAKSEVFAQAAGCVPRKAGSVPSAGQSAGSFRGRGAGCGGTAAGRLGQARCRCRHGRPDRGSRAALRESAAGPEHRAPPPKAAAGCVDRRPQAWLAGFRAEAAQPGRGRPVTGVARRDQGNDRPPPGQGEAPAPGCQDRSMREGAAALRPIRPTPPPRTGSSSAARPRRSPCSPCRRRRPPAAASARFAAGWRR